MTAWRGIKTWHSMMKAWHIMMKHDGVAQHESVAQHDEA
jgi:hypothetical protein